MSRLPLPKELTIPKAHKKHLKSVLNRYPNARLLCEEGRYQDAAALLREDGLLSAPNWLMKINCESSRESRA